MLTAEDGSWLDGGEERVREILASASDLSSLSDELNRHDESWEVRYHLAAERANIVRPLTLAADARVLEIGAGCGAITRYLGEVAGVVDAVEPTPARARVARLRTRDLDTVEVFAGWLEQIPREPTYDAVILVGVLEYVGARDGLEDRVRMLSEAAARLRPGGAVVCAIENRLGVQYLAGAPEEHVGRAFAGVDGYPQPGPVRTFSRADLERLFSEAGLVPRTQHVFPDYKFARVVYADSLLSPAAAPLAWRAPNFPSAGSPHPRARLASEERLWRALVQTGAGGQFANSFLVVATPGEEPGPWPTDLHAAFYAVNRRSEFACETRVTGDASAPRLFRRRLGFGEARSGTLSHRAEGSSWHAGIPLLELLEDAPEAELARRLTEWRELVERTPPETEGANIDHGPNHILVTGDRFVTVDAEWFDSSYGPDAVVARGLLHAALTLADCRAPECWPEGSERVADVLLALARASGAPEVVDRLEEVLRREAELLAEVQVAPADSPEWEGAVEQRLADLRAALDRPLSETVLAPRDFASGSADVYALLDRRHHEVDWLHAEVAQRDRRLAELEAAHMTVVQSRSWRLTHWPRRLAATARRRWREA